MKKLTIEEIKTISPEILEYSKVKDAISVADGVNPIHPCKILFSLDDSGLLSHVEVVLDHPTLYLNIMYRGYQKQYVIWCESFQELKNSDYYTRREIAKGMTEPNNIGVPTAKKIGDWIKYYEELYAKVKKIDDENGGKKEKFLKSLEGLDVKWDRDKSGGWIVKNHMKYEFNIGVTYITESIEVDYTASNNLETFLKLSDNGYKSK